MAGFSGRLKRFPHEAFSFWSSEGQEWMKRAHPPLQSIPLMLLSHHSQVPLSVAFSLQPDTLVLPSVKWGVWLENNFEGLTFLPLHSDRILPVLCDFWGWAFMGQGSLISRWQQGRKSTLRCWAPSPTSPRTPLCPCSQAPASSLPYWELCIGQTLVCKLRFHWKTYW